MDPVWVIAGIAVALILLTLGTLLLPFRRGGRADESRLPAHGEVLETTAKRAMYFQINEEQVRSLYSQMVRSLRTNVHVETVQEGRGEANLALQGVGIAGGVSDSTSTSYDVPDHSSLDRDFVANVVRRSVEIDHGIPEIDLRVDARRRQIEQFVNEVKGEGQKIGLDVPDKAIKLIEAAWEQQDSSQSAERLVNSEGGVRLSGTFSVIGVPPAEAESGTLRLERTLRTAAGDVVRVEVLANWVDVRISARSAFTLGEEVNLGCYGQLNKQPDRTVKVLPVYSYWL